MTDRRTGSVGVTVDLDRRPGITLERQTGALGVLVDLKVLPLLSGAVSQATAVSVQLVVIPGGTTYPLTVSASQGIAVLLRLEPYRLRVAAIQATAATLDVFRLPTSIPLTVTATQATQVVLALQKTLRFTLSATQAQLATSSIGRGSVRTVTATQTQAVRLVKQVRLLVRTTGTHRVQTSVRLGRVVGRALRATLVTSPRLPKQIRLTRAITQAQSATLAGVPVQLRVLSTVQTRSLDLGRNVFLTRLLQQATALVLARVTSLERTAVQPTLVTLERAVSRVVAVSVTTQATLEWTDVTPRYEVLVTASVSQQVALSSDEAGQSAKQFLVDMRRAEFIVGARGNNFAVGRRGVRFTVEER